jgi:hypothetical protein
MHKKNTLFALTVLAYFWASTALASALDASDDVGYIEQGTTGSGWVNVRPATDGIYVHGASKTKEANRPDQVFMVGTPPRQDFVFLNAQEQEGIWRYRQAQREALRKAAKAALPHPVDIQTSHKKYLASLNWPRVVVEGNQVCVPDVEFSDAHDWKDHLLCTYVESLHAQ